MVFTTTALLFLLGACFGVMIYAEWTSRRSPRRLEGAPAAAGRPLPYTRLTLEDWRSSPERVAYVELLLKDAMFLQLVSMLANIRPASRGPVDATTAAILLGQRLGHDQVIASLLAAGTPPPPAPIDLPADYGAENALAAWEKEGTL